MAAKLNRRSCEVTGAPEEEMNHRRRREALGGRGPGFPGRPSPAELRWRGRKKQVGAAAIIDKQLWNRYGTRKVTSP